MLFNARQHHPSDPSRGKIDLGLVLPFMPLLLVGINIGVLLNTIFPNWLITLLLVLLIIYLTYTSAVRGLTMWKKQSAQAKQVASDGKPQESGGNEGKDVESQSHGSSGQRDAARLMVARSGSYLADGSGDPDVSENAQGKGQATGDQSSGAPQHSSGTLQQAGSGAQGPDVSSSEFKDADPGASSPGGVSELNLNSKSAGEDHDSGRQLGWARLQRFLPVVTLFLLWGIFAGIQVARQTLSRCGVGWALVYTLQMSIMTIASLLFVWVTIRDNERAQVTAAAAKALALVDDAGKGSELQRSDSSLGIFTLTWPKVPFCLGMTLVAGVLGGLLGLGGGIIMSPLLISLGVHPQVGAASTSVMVVFSSAAAVVQFGTQGLLNLQYGFICGVVSAVGSLLGVAVVGRWIARTGKSSIVILMLAGMVGIGGVLALVFGTLQAVEDLDAGSYMGFLELC